MTNETKWTYAASVALEASGASIANAAFSASTNATTILSSTNHSNYPYADFVLKVSTLGASTASNANGYVAMYRIDQDMATATAADGTYPSSNYRNTFVGSFTIPNSLASTSIIYIPLLDVPLGENQQYALENSASQTLAAGWSLTVRPKAIVPG
jgi:hypothetical protein